MKKAIILLGAHGAGKDTVANELISRDPGKYYNAKFSKLLKQVVASAFHVDLKQMEDKKWRITDGYLGVTPSEVLNALFFGLEHVLGLQAKVVDNCLDGIPDDCIPIFTDIRRYNELDQVLCKYGEDNVYVLKLSRKSSTPDKTDTLLITDYPVLNNDLPIVEVVDELIELTDLDKPINLPTVHVLFCEHSRFPRHLPNLDFTSLQHDRLHSVYKGLYPESDEHELKLLIYTTIDRLLEDSIRFAIPEIKKDCVVYYAVGNPSTLFEEIRKYAIIKWYVQTDKVHLLAGVYKNGDQICNE